MNGDPGDPAFRARVNIDGPVNMRASVEKESRAMNFPSRATRRDTGRQVGVNVVGMSSSCGMKVAEMDALDEGGRGPELAARTAHHKVHVTHCR